MTSPNWRDIGASATNLPNWEWMPGMLARCGSSPNGNRLNEIYDGGDSLVEGGWWPDFSDPATVGCLLALARKVLSDPALYAGPADGWYVNHHSRCIAAGPSEPEALIEALRWHAFGRSA